MIVDIHKILFIIFLTILIYHLNIKLCLIIKYSMNTKFLKFNFEINRWIYYFFIHTFFKLYFDCRIIFLFYVFVSGILSDNKIFNSPVRRLFSNQ